MKSSTKSFKVMALKPTAGDGDHAGGTDGVHLTGGLNIKIEQEWQLDSSSKSFKAVALKPTAGDGDHAEGVDGVHLTRISTSRSSRKVNGKFQ